MSEDLSSHRHACLVLNGLPLMGPITLRRLLEHFNGDPLRVLRAPRRELEKVPHVGPAVADSIVSWETHFHLQRELDNLDKTGAQFVVEADDCYPELLKQIHDPPIGLYWLGEYQIDCPCIAIVGTRAATRYGLDVAGEIAGTLARMGFCIVSGMARGIDRVAHEEALENGGRTLAVFGNGLDIIYPPENVDIYQEIRRRGAVISEFPFGKRANRTTFPMRNRVVSGICQAVIVVETDNQGGSMITARFAAEQNRTVFAVPGRIDMPSSAGCLQLIRDGAVMLTSVRDILDELGYGSRLEQAALFPEKENKKEETDPHEDILLKEFAGGSILDRDTLADRTNLPIQEVASRLMNLELERKIVKRSDGRFELRGR